MCYIQVWLQIEKRIKTKSRGREQGCVTKGSRQNLDWSCIVRLVMCAGLCDFMYMLEVTFKGEIRTELNISLQFSHFYFSYIDEKSTIPQIYYPLTTGSTSQIF